MSESYQQRCVECGDQGVAVEPRGTVCARHAAVSDAAEILARLAKDAMAAIPEGDGQAARRSAQVAEYKNKTWLDRVLEVTRSASAHTAFTAMRRTTALFGIQKWLEAGCPNAIVLRGGVGAGKTTAACYAVRHWLEPDVVWDEGTGAPWVNEARGQNVTWLRPDQLVSAIMHDYDERSPVLRKYVVIDDMGRETRGEFVEALCELFDRNGHTILITSNLPKDEMRKRYAKEPRLISRLAHHARAVDCPEESLRKKNGDF